MNQQLKANKQILRTFMRDHYTDDRLTQLLDHARSGKLSFYSCCCFIGITTAKHALMSYGQYESNSREGHYAQARKLTGAGPAETAYCRLGMINNDHDDRTTIVRIIPIILAEIQRRQRLNRPVILPEKEIVESCSI